VAEQVTAVTERIPIASDHAGFEMKEKLERVLHELGYEVEDLGTDSPTSTDYPDYGHPLARAVSEGRARRGVLLCGTGLGMSYVANRYSGVRAAVAWSPEIAELSRKHNDANVLVLPARFVSDGDSVAILRTFLETAFDGGRHVNRVDKIDRRNGPEAG
jgi:ribose 5-phosphate isomerase B